jgi:Rrf2 family transcriptional regulator, cysteine metabolism repressor
MMRMSTKGHHAIRIMVFLAHSPGRPITKQEIGASENISPGYIQQLMGRLTNAGLVRSHRGKEGGFSLGLPAEEITVQQVLRVTEGPFELAACAAHPESCPRAETCPANPLWAKVTAAVNDLFDHTTIADLAQSLQSAAQSAISSPE